MSTKTAPKAARRARAIAAARSPLRTIAELAAQLTRSGRQRRRTRILAAAERAEALQRAQAFDRLRRLGSD